MKKSVKPITILIANATSPKNPGDQAMLAVLIDLVKSVYSRVSITVHSADPHLYTQRGFSVKPTLYSWSAFEDRSTLTRLFRVATLLLQYMLLRAGLENVMLDKNLGDLVADYRRADLILFAGGGYLRSRKGVTQSLNVLMQLMMFKYAALYKAKKIVGPISIGPFGYPLIEKVAMRELRKMDRVAVREGISFALAKKHELKNAVQSSDHALMVQKRIKSKKDRKTITLGFAMRQWLQGEKQTRLEEAVVWAIEHFVLLTGARVQPIVQVDASEYGEDDAAITKAIMRKLRRKGIKLLPVKTVTSVSDALRAYSRLDLLLGMRMHANIFAAHQGVPFVAISYEHKTEGIAQGISMKDYCISCETIDGKRLYNLLALAFTKRKHLRRQLIHALETIQKTEVPQWNKYLAMKQ